MTHEYGPWTEYAGEDLGDALVQVQMRCQSREEAEQRLPDKASDWNWGDCGEGTNHAYRKVLEPRVATIHMHSGYGAFYLNLGHTPTDKNFALTFPVTKSGKLDFSRQPTWREME